MRPLRLPLLAFSILTAAALAMAACAQQSNAPAAATEGPEPLTFAQTREFWTAPTIVAREKGLFQQAGLDVNVATFESGLEAKNAVLTGGAETGLVATTPLAISGFQKEQLRVICTYFESERVVKLVASDKVNTSALAKYKIGYVPGTISEHGLDLLAQDREVPRRSLNAVAFRPPELVLAFTRGDIDGFVAWEPFPIKAANAVKNARVTELTRGLAPDGAPLFTVSLHIVARPETIAKRQSALTKFVVALRNAESWIKSNPQEAQRIVEKYAGLSAGELEPLWPFLRFNVKLDPDGLTRSLEAEGRWAQAAGYAKGPMPEYRTLIDTSIIRLMPEVSTP